MKLLALVLIYSACFILLESRQFQHSKRKGKTFRSNKGHRKRFRQQPVTDDAPLTPEEMYQCNDFQNLPDKEAFIPEYTELEIQCSLGCLRIISASYNCGTYEEDSQLTSKLFSYCKNSMQCHIQATTDFLETQLDCGEFEEPTLWINFNCRGRDAKLNLIRHNLTIAFIEATTNIEPNTTTTTTASPSPDTSEEISTTEVISTSTTTSTTYYHLPSDDTTITNFSNPTTTSNPEAPTTPTTPTGETSTTSISGSPNTTAYDSTISTSIPISTTTTPDTTPTISTSTSTTSTPDTTTTISTDDPADTPSTNPTSSTTTPITQTTTIIITELFNFTSTITSDPGSSTTTTPTTTSTTPTSFVSDTMDPSITTTNDVETLVTSNVTVSSQGPLTKNCTNTKGPTRRGTEKYGTELILRCKGGCLSIHKALMDCEISRFRLSDMYHLQRVRDICQDQEFCSFNATRDFFDYRFKCEDINPIFYMEISCDGDPEIVEEQFIKKRPRGNTKYDCVEDHVRYTGETVEQTKQPNGIKCYEKCKNSPSCNFWSYNKKNKNCNLKTEIGERKLNARNLLSAPKDCDPKPYLDGWIVGESPSRKKKKSAVYRRRKKKNKGFLLRGKNKGFVALY